MNIVNNIWMPDVQNFVYGELRFDLREGVPIAVVIVSGVVMINLRRRSSFGGSVQRFLIPVGNNIWAVWVQ